MLLLVAGCCGCRQLPRHDSFFPLGLYGVTSTNDFSMVREAGFNVVVGPAEKNFLDAAQGAGLKVLATYGGEAGLDRHPALWAWCLADEPDLHQKLPAEVSGLNARLRQAGARKPTLVTLWSGGAALDYGKTPDLVMVDRYPVPWLPLASLGQEVRVARVGIGRGKPLLAVLQAFPWSIFPELLPDEPQAKTFRAPTGAELRCMAYDALARGANGFFYYTFSAQHWRLAEQPVLWAEVKALAGEMQARAPLFQGAAQWWPRRQHFHDPRQRFNGALESSISTAWLKVQTGNATIPAGDYLVAVNNTERDILYSVTLPWPAEAPAVVGEKRAGALNGEWLEDYFAPYEVHVYGPLRAKGAGGR